METTDQKNYPPARVFLDTNVVNFILDHGPAIFEGERPEATRLTDIADVDALRLIFHTGQRAHWQLAVSPTTFEEVRRTSCPNRRRDLESWLREIWHYWNSSLDANFRPLSPGNAQVATHLASLEALRLPDAADKELIGHAIAFECDVFCTRDRRTILKYKDRLEGLPLEFLTPAEWGHRILPFASLFV